MEQDYRRLSRSNSLPELPEHRLEATPSVALITGPGGFRRFFVHERKRDPKENFFVSFLELYRHFGGDTYYDDEDVICTDDEETRLLLQDIDTREEQQKQPVGHNTLGKTYFLILKAFVGTGILFLPKAYSNGGMVFSSMLLILVAWISLYGMLLLVEVKDKEKVQGYAELAYKLFGNKFRILVQISIVLSQMGFCCAYVVFVAQNLRELLLDVSNCKWDIHPFLLVIGQLLVYIPLCLVRQVRYFSISALIADVFILFGIFYVLYYDIYLISTKGIGPAIVLINEKKFAMFIGTAVFAFEGIGMILPINSAMAEPKKFSRALSVSIFMITVTLLTVGILSYLAFGAEVQTVLLLNLPKNNAMVRSVQGLYAIAILLTFPLMAFPALRIIETYFVPLSGRNDWRQKWKKNSLRTILVILMAFISYLGSSDLDKFVSLIGALSCVPLSFIFPAFLHYKSLANDNVSKIKDIALAVFGIVCMIITTVITVQSWIVEGEEQSSPKSVKRTTDEYFSKTWPKLEESVKSIFQKTKIEYSLEELYRYCENICHYNSKLGEELLNKLKVLISNRVDGLVDKSSFSCTSDSKELAEVVSAYEGFMLEIKLIRNLFLYADRTCLLKSENPKNFESIFDYSIRLVRERLLSQDGKLVHDIIESILHLINGYRSSSDLKQVDLVQKGIQMLASVGCKESLEERYLSELRDYYNDKTAKMLMENQDDLKLYVQYCQNFLAKENGFIPLFSLEQKRHVILFSIQKVLISGEIVRRLLNAGIGKLIEEKEHQVLKSLYGIMSSVDEVETLRAVFSEYLKSKGTTLVSGEDYSGIVTSLLSFKNLVDAAVINSFQQDASTTNSSFNYAVQNSFEVFTNKNPKFPEMLAKYLDSIMKDKSSHEELLNSNVINQIISLFRYVQGKDMFEAFYKELLAKRLLSGKSSSIDLEKTVLLKFKNECGPGFTQKLEGMFNDLAISKEIMNGFKGTKAFVEYRKTVDFSVQTLTLAYWPNYTIINGVLLPDLIAKAQVSFEKFYTSKYANRRLTFVNSLGHCSVKANCFDKELGVSVFQTIVLLLFNDMIDLTYEEIKIKTNLPDDELLKTLTSLSLGKHKILLKNNNAKSVSPSDSFKLNLDFKHPLKKLKINTVQFKQTVQEEQRTEQQVNIDRQYQLDAAIVRIMKSRRTITHSQLVTELFEVIGKKFVVGTQEVKKRVESLIDREYIERSTKDKDLYTYVA